MAAICSIEGCSNLVFRTDKLTRKRYCSNHWRQHSTDIDKRPMNVIAQDKANQQQRKPSTPSTKNNLSRAVGRLKGDKPTGVVGSKSELLREADRVFSLWIRNRDSKGGKVKCPCCNKVYDADAQDSEGAIIQNLHFIDRDVYNLRYSEENCHAGCKYCNLKQHLAPKGEQYQNYRNFLVEQCGEEVVAEMELEFRKINKLESEQLKIIIEHYS